MTHAPLVSLDDRQALHDPSQHLAALTRLSSERLADGDAFAAFRFADRRCRVGPPRPHDLLLRGEALRRLGFKAAAHGDMAAAAALDPTDPFVNHRLIQAGGADAVVAARWVVGDPRASQALLEVAVTLLFERGLRTLASVTVEEGRLTGWVASREPRNLTLRVALRAGVSDLPLTTGADAPAGGRAAFRRFAMPLAGAFEHVALLAGCQPCADALLNVRVNPSLSPPRETSAPPRDAPEQPAADLKGAASARRVTVIVPIYDDVPVTRRCLDALAAQRDAAIEVRIVMVDDAAPDPAMGVLLADAVARYRFERLVNPRNLGYIGAVNAALERVVSGDVVLLNADVVLPPGALGRLAAAAHARPGIGIANPLTNNGQFLSFPSMVGDNPFADEAGIAAIDGAAARAAPDALVSTPGGIGFCLYVTRACLDAVGPMPEVYLRGYFEDIEFCLRAEERGFETVCAPGIFVGHKGSASFKGEKKRLVERNRRAIEGRFPRYRAELEAFHHADPLRPARAAIEDVVSPLGRAAVVLAGGALYAAVLAARAVALGAVGTDVVILTWSVENGVLGARFSRPREAGPRQRTYHLGETVDVQALQADLRALGAGRIEVAGAPGAFGPVLDAALQQGLAYGVVLSESIGRAPSLDQGCQRLDEAEPCAACIEQFNARWQPHGVGGDLHRTWQRGSAAPALFVAMDAMAAEVATDLCSDAFPASRIERSLVSAPPRAAAAGLRRPLLALPYPEPDHATERFLSILARTLLRGAEKWQIILLGAGLDDRRLMSAGNLHPTGPVAETDYADAVRHYGATCLLAPCRWAGYGLVARLAEALERPKAYFDWSIGACPAGEGDLSLDPRVCDAKAAQAVASWLGAQAMGSAW